MKNYDLLNKFVDAVIKDSEDAEAIYKEYATNMATSFVNKLRKNNLIESHINEIFGDSAIKLKGNDVVINGKTVGQVSTDLNEIDSGINFVSADGRFSKEFNDIPSFYQYLARTFGVKENDMTGNLGTKIETPKELDLCDEEKPKLPPHANDEADKKNKNKKEFKPDASLSVGPDARINKLKSIVANIKNGGRPTSSKETVNETPKLETKNIDKTGKLKRVTKYTKAMKKEADKNGNKE